MYRWIEVRHASDHLEEIHKLLLHINCCQNSSGGIICVTHWAESPGTKDCKASFIRDYFTKRTFHPVNLLLNDLNDFLNDLKRRRNL